ncbi:MAG TPA: hypothetical protein VNO81_09730, partial [Candidatus Nitrosotenuis sp.]|nr:hypothetical protein [Candidatus Nitrosotenuis sp.]
LETRAARAGLRSSAFWFGLTALLYGLPALILAWFLPPEAVQTFLSVSGLVLLVALPCYHFRADVSLLTALRRGRCLEEILCSGLGAPGIVDALAGYSVGSLLRTGLPVALVLLAGVPAFPAEVRGLALGAALLWLPAVVVLFWAGSYAVQMMIASSRDGGETTTPLSVGLLVLVLAPLVLASWLASLGPAGGVVAGVGSLLWIALASRRLAVWALENPGSVERLNQKGFLGRGRRNRWVRAWSDNPIVAREAWRSAAAVPFGLPGLFLSRLAGVALPAGWALLLTLVDPDQGETCFWWGLAGVAAMVFLQAASRTAGAVVEEREGRTLESLMQSGLTSREFVEGWLQVGMLPTLAQLVPTAAILLASGAWLPQAVVGPEAAASEPMLGLATALLMVLALFLLTLAGAWVGLWVSAASPSRRQAGASLVSLTGRGLLAWLGVWGALVGGATGLALAGYLDSSGSLWTPFVQKDAPVAALALVALAAVLWGRRQVGRDLAAHWRDEGLAALPAPAADAAEGLARRLVLVPAVAVGVVGASYSGMIFALLMGGLREHQEEWAGTLLLALGLGLGLVVQALLRPLARPLAQHLGHNTTGAACLGALLGAGSGTALALLPESLRGLIWLGLVPDWWSPLVEGAGRLAWMGWGGLSGALVGALWGVGGVLAGPRRSPPSLPLEQRLRRAAMALLPALGRMLLVGLTVVLASLWLARRACWVEVQHPALAARIVEETRGRAQAWEAVPDEQDGYELLRWWLTNAGETWGLSVLMPCYTGNREAIVEALGQNPEQTSARVERFVRSLWLVREALARPEFCPPPVWEQLDRGRLLNYLRPRILAQNLVVLGVYYEEQGRRLEALEAYLLALRLGESLAGKGGLVHEISAVEVQQIALDGLLPLLGEGSLTPADYRRVERALAGCRLGRESFAASMDHEFVTGLTLFDELLAGRLPPQVLGGDLSWMPAFYIERERNTYINFYLKYRAAVQRLENPDPDFWRDLDRSGVLVRWLVPDYRGPVRQVKLVVTRREAARALCALELYRVEKGRYPRSLAELAQPPLDLFTPGGMGYRLTGDSFELYSRSDELSTLGPFPLLPYR